MNKNKNKKVQSKIKPKKRSSSVFSRIGLSKEKLYFVEMLSMLLGSGMDVILALESIKQEVKTKRMKAIINEMLENIEAGESLWRALEAGHLLSDHVISLIRVGEESGRLSENLEIIALQQKRDGIFKSRVRSALIYPILIVVLTFIIIIGISWFILPRFVSVFKVLNKDLPLLTKILVKVGELFVNYGFYIVPGIVIVLILLIYFLFVFSKTKIAGQWLLLHLPVSKKIAKEIELARSGYIMGTLLAAGLPVVATLESLTRATNLYPYKKLYQHLQKSVLEGNSFLNSFRSYKKIDKYFPPSLQQMIGSAEKSGRLAESFINIGKSYEVKTEISAQNLATLIEPILLIVIGIGVLLVALAVITPIYGLLGNLG